MALCPNINLKEWTDLVESVGKGKAYDLWNQYQGEVPSEFYNKTSIKEGVSEVFNENPKLAKIGTEQQYSSYLNTIFPTSTVKDILYHGTSKIFKKFKKEFRGSNTGKSVENEDNLKFDSEYLFMFTNNKTATLQYSVTEKINNQNETANLLYNLWSTIGRKNNKEEVINISKELKKLNSKIHAKVKELIVAYNKKPFNERDTLKDLKRPILSIRNKLMDESGEFSEGNINQFVSYERAFQAFIDLKARKNEIINNKNYIHNSFANGYPKMSIDLYENNKLILYINDDGKIITGDSRYKESYRNKNITELSSSEFDNLINLGIKNNKKGFDKVKQNFKNYSPKSRVLKTIIDLKNPIVKDFNGTPFVMQYDGTGALVEVSEMAKEASSNSSNDGIIAKNIKDPLLMNSYGVLESEQIHILGSDEDIQGFEDFVNNNDQKPEQKSTTTSKSLDVVKQAINKMGISLQDLNTYLKGNPNVNAKNVNALANLTEGIIAISQGSDEVILTEEMVHIATAILEQTNPSLVNNMITKIGKYKIYKDTLALYKDNPAYQLPNGKPNIRKIKKEAVDKLITEIIINQSQNLETFPELAEENNVSFFKNMWQKILNFFGSSYEKSGIDLYNTAADLITGSEDIGTVDDIIIDDENDNGVYFNVYSEAQQVFQRRLEETKNIIKKRKGDKQEIEEEKNPANLDAEKSTNYYEKVNTDSTTKRLNKRVTDRVKAWYRSKFGDKTFTKYQEELNEFKKEQGTKFHLFFEEIHDRYFNEDGSRKTVVTKRIPKADKKDRIIYGKLESYFVGLVDSFISEGKEPLVFSEKIVYDPKNEEAGTVDLMIVEQDGTVNIFDWKFMSVGANAKDVAWFKQGAYDIQLGTYKKILKDYYGVKKVRYNRAIPILLDIRSKKVTKKGGEKIEVNFVNDIEIGSVDAKTIKDLRLLPVSESTESTGDQKLDDLISNLNAVHSRISNTTANSEEEKDLKKDQLNIIKAAARIIQGTLNVEPLVEVISNMRLSGENIINDYELLFKNKKNKDNLSNKEISEFAESLQDYLAIGEAFGTIGDEISAVIYRPGSENETKNKKEKETLLKKKELAEQIQKETTQIRLLTNKIKGSKKNRKLEPGIAGLFADEFIGRRNLVSGLLDVSKDIKSIWSWFRGVSDLSLPATNVLFKVVTNAKAQAERDSFERITLLDNIRTRIMSKGGNIRERLSALYQKDKDGNKTNYLIHKYDKKFYKAVDDLAASSDRRVGVLRQMINVKEYKKEANKKLKERIESLTKLYNKGGTFINLESLIQEEIDKYDIDSDTFNGFNNYIIKNHPKEQWLSKEYKELKEDEDVFDLYNFIVESNKKANEIGYIENKVKNIFLPFVRKGFAESLAWDVSLSAVKRLGQGLSVRPDDVGYGAVDELNRELVNTIPKYYTYDFSRTEEGEIDMSDVSEELFKNLSLYVSHVERYKYLSDVEGQLTLVKTIESFKDSYTSTTVGNVAVENGVPITKSNNEINTRIYTNFLNSLLYDQKYPVSATDVSIPGISQAVEYGKQLISFVTGREYNPKEATLNSLYKTIDAGNRYFQIKTLGFSILSGAANAFGNAIQMSAQAGVYFSTREYGNNAFDIMKGKFSNKEEKDMFVDLINVFMPLKDSPSYELMKKSGLSKLTRENWGDLIFVFMRKPELLVEKAMFMSLLKSTMVQNGKIISIKDYVNSKYKDRYQSSSNFRANKLKIKKEIEELKKTKSLYATKTMVDNKVQIPGLDLNNRNEIQRLTNLTRRLSRNATGSNSDSDINQTSQNIFTASAMVFKGWIPKLMDTRFGEFRVTSDDFNIEIDENGLTTGEKYDIGRVRILAYVVGKSIRERSSNVKNILKFNEKGALMLDEMYEDYAKKFVKRTGRELIYNNETGEYDNFISKSDFNDLIRTNLRNQLKELGILLTLFLATVAVPPPDDEMSRSEKNFYRFTEKVINRFVSELMFFYNPAEFQNLLSGNMFPVIGVVTDIEKFVAHTAMEISGIDISNPDKTREEVFKDAQPLKYGAKMVPLAKELLNYGAMISDDFAKDFDIYIQSKNR